MVEVRVQKAIQSTVQRREPVLSTAEVDVNKRPAGVAVCRRPPFFVDANWIKPYNVTSLSLFDHRHSGRKDCGQNVVPQDFQDQALPRQEAEAEQADSSVDQNENRQQDQVQFQEETLEEDQARPVNMRVLGL
ncbi:hypothetical protein EXN66_Car009761 [Channa argus]|uniref:Uncharacterized protein n=1 Tax=Channa argus TaxID=215402 RepID=A0A6G1PUZ0_CHAAH|nr:hypothetical protein EXN66_Car009761 [Channa argus]